MNELIGDEQYRPGFEANYTAWQKRSGATDDYVFLTLQRQANGDYHTTAVQGRWEGWVAAKLDEMAQSSLPVHAAHDEVLNLARQALENSKSEDVARDVERRKAIKAITAVLDPSGQ